ncbi:hypothetical protein C0991_005497 [Blastosporella zonata]|nr:hypothetical protein C0991_005497 [Blastosporella zonata]
MVGNSLEMDVPTLFASNLRTFSNNTITDLQYAGLTRDEELSREALQVAAGLFKMWDQRPEKLQDEEWTEEAAVLEAGQDLWTAWSLKEWAQEAPYNKFFSVFFKAMVPGQRSVALADINMGDTMEMPLFEEDSKDFETSPVQKPYSTSEGLGKRKAREISGGVNMDSGPSNARPSKVSKTGSGQPSTKQAKAPVDISGAHVTCQQCTTAKVADHCWYPQARLPCCHCLNSGVACRNSAGDTARDAQRRTRVVRKRAKRAAAPATRAARASGDGEEEVSRVPDLGKGDDEEEIAGEGISGVPELEEERYDGAPAGPEVAEGDEESESARSVWRPADEPMTEFAWGVEGIGGRDGRLRRHLQAGVGGAALRAAAPPDNAGRDLAAAGGAGRGEAGGRGGTLGHFGL